MEWGTELDFRKVEHVQDRKANEKSAAGNYIKDEDVNILSEGGNVANRWKRNFEGILNSENPSNFEDTPATEGPIMDIFSGKGCSST